MIEIVEFFRDNASAVIGLLIWLAGALIEESKLAKAREWLSSLSPRRKFALFFVITFSQAIGLGIYQAWPFSFAALPGIIWDAAIIFLQQQVVHMVYSRQRYLSLIEELSADMASDGPDDKDDAPR